MKRKAPDIEQMIAGLDGELESLMNTIPLVGDSAPLKPQVIQLKERRDKLMEEYIGLLGPEGVLKIARHQDRPHCLDVVAALTDNFLELRPNHEPGLVGGLAIINHQKVVIIGQQKGRTTSERIRRNFAATRPAGYQKAMHLMDLAVQFSAPICCIVDTPAADCEPDSEAGGIGQAIAQSIMKACRLPVPILVTIIGEGGSGGALGIGVGDRVLMMEHAVFSVIPPEGAAAILWRDASKVNEASQALGIGAKSNLDRGIIEEIIPEPAGGAHQNPRLATRLVAQAITKNLAQLTELPPDTLLEMREKRYRKF